MKALNITVDKSAGSSSYPYKMNFGDYMPSAQVARVIASTVKGLDEENSDIAAEYSSGTASFAAIPARVSYVINTAFKDLSMDVTIGAMYYVSLSLSNHVHRVFSPAEAKNWQEADDYCRTLGGHLATITSEEENELIAELIDRAWLADEPRTYYWLGRRYPDDS